MPLIVQNNKRYFLYALIGLFLGGGAIPSMAFAYTNTFSASAYPTFGTTTQQETYCTGLGYRVPTYFELVRAYQEGFDFAAWIGGTPWVFYQATSTEHDQALMSSDPPLLFGPVGYGSTWLGTCISDGSPPYDADHSTHIISFTPSNNELITHVATTTPVTFSLHAYINEDDIGNFLTIKIIYRNIDQNTLLNAPCNVNTQIACSIYSFDIFRGLATTSGDFYVSTTTGLADGNYRVEASLDTATQLLGLNLGLFPGTISDVKNHQFIVGSSTFIGNLSQTVFTETDSFFGTLQATSSSALAQNCSPLSSSFGVRECLAFLLIPDGQQINDLLVNFRDGVLIRAPWGYVTRFIVIISGTATSSLPTFTVNLGVPGSPLASSTLSFDPGDMLVGGAALLDSIQDPYSGNTMRDIFYPMIQLGVALGVILTIVMDLMGTPHAKHKDRNQK